MSAFPALKANRFKVYCSVNSASALPATQIFLSPAPSFLAGLSFPDTMQLDHVDWGFRFSPMMAAIIAGPQRKDGLTDILSRREPHSRAPSACAGTEAGCHALFDP
jgi:hypothetical protein